MNNRGRRHWLGISPHDYPVRIVSQVPPRSIEDIFQPLWTPADAASYLGLHEKTAIKMARLQQIPAIRLGKHWRFRASDLTAWVATQVQSSRQPVE
jgi:excisionase family DNA binding protein